MSVEIWFQSGLSRADVCVRLGDVDPRGAARNFTTYFNSYIDVNSKVS